jgi:hypothetical protein
MISYEKGRNKKITISILPDNKFKLRKTNLDIDEVIELLTINMAAFVAENTTEKQRDNIMEELKRSMEWYVMKNLSREAIL